MSRLDNTIEYVHGTENQYILRSAKNADEQAERRQYPPDSPEWFEWVAGLGSFRFVGRYGHFTARQEFIGGKEKKPSGEAYWYAYRKFQGHQFKRYLGTNGKLTLQYLEETARQIEETMKQKFGIPLEESFPPFERLKSVPPNETVLLQRLEKQEQEIITLRAQNQELQSAVATLEARLQAARAKREKRVGPKAEEAAPAGFSWLADFASQHVVPYGEAERLYNMGMIAGQKMTMSRGRAPIAIGPKGRRDFWVQLHIDPSFRSCDDCPHQPERL